MINKLKVNKLYRIKFNVNPDDQLFGGYYLPVIVLEEYEYFYRCEVIPHRNSKLSQGVSNPYPMTINKIDLMINSRVVDVKDYYPPTGKEAP